MPLIKQCRLCSKEFRTKPFFVKNGGGKYCSRLCSDQARRVGKVIKCYICGKEVYKQKKDLLKFKNFFVAKIAVYIGKIQNL